jgi:signal transduction histidine kinase
MVSLRHKYFMIQAFSASVTFAALALLFYICNHGFTNLVGISAKNLSALYSTGELKSQFWRERSELKTLDRKGYSKEFEKASILATHLRTHVSEELRVTIDEFVRIHEAIRKSVLQVSQTGSRSDLAFASTFELYARGNEKLDEFSDGLVLSSGESQSETIRKTNLAMKIALFGALLFTVVIKFFSFLYARRSVITPIVRISEASLAAARGEFHTIPPTGSGDEISVLATNFNHMTAEIQRTSGELGELNRTLEKRVAERSAQLGETERKLAAAAKMSALGSMAGGVAHEINTPLGAIGLITEQIQELVEEEPFDRSTVTKMTKTITTTVGRISEIIKGLRTFSRDGSQDSFESVTVREIVDDTLILCNERLKHSNIELRISPIADELRIQCQPVQISQVLLNLIGNSCDAIRDLPEKWIEVLAERRGERIRISVTDSGRGISEANRSKLFQPFFTTKEIGKGTGLGLSISHGILNSHRGTLSLDTSSENTRFVIELPRPSETSDKIPSQSTG